MSHEVLLKAYAKESFVAVGHSMAGPVFVLPIACVPEAIPFNGRAVKWLVARPARLELGVAGHCGNVCACCGTCFMSGFGCAIGSASSFAISVRSCSEICSLPASTANSKKISRVLTLFSRRTCSDSYLVLLASSSLNFSVSICCTRSSARCTRSSRMPFSLCAPRRRF